SAETHLHGRLLPEPERPVAVRRPPREAGRAGEAVFEIAPHSRSGRRRLPGFAVRRAGRAEPVVARPGLRRLRRDVLEAAVAGVEARVRSPADGPRRRDPESEGEPRLRVVEPDATRGEPLGGIGVLREARRGIEGRLPAEAGRDARGAGDGV